MSNNKKNISRKSKKDNNSKVQTNIYTYNISQEQLADIIAHAILAAENNKKQKEEEEYHNNKVGVIRGGIIVVLSCLSFLFVVNALFAATSLAYYSVAVCITLAAFLTLLAVAIYLCGKYQSKEFTMNILSLVLALFAIIISILI